MRQLELFEDEYEVGEKRKEYICPECNKIHEDPNRPPEGCDMVYGRRGWRQLGVYDG